MRPCPNCGSDYIKQFNSGVSEGRCQCLDCAMSGPVYDPCGLKWDALPRRGELTITQTLETVSTDTDREAWRAYAVGVLHALCGNEHKDDVINAAKEYADDMLSAEKHRFEDKP